MLLGVLKRSMYKSKTERKMFVEKESKIKHSLKRYILSGAKKIPLRELMY